MIWTINDLPWTALEAYPYISTFLYVFHMLVFLFFIEFVPGIVNDVRASVFCFVRLPFLLVRDVVTSFGDICASREGQAMVKLSHTSYHCVYSALVKLHYRTARAHRKLMGATIAPLVGFVRSTYDISIGRIHTAKLLLRQIIIHDIYMYPNTLSILALTLTLLLLLNVLSVETQLCLVTVLRHGSTFVVFCAYVLSSWASGAEGNTIQSITTTDQASSPPVLPASDDTAQEDDGLPAFEDLFAMHLMSEPAPTVKSFIPQLEQLRDSMAASLTSTMICFGEYASTHLYTEATVSAVYTDAVSRLSILAADTVTDELDKFIAEIKGSDAESPPSHPLNRKPRFSERVAGIKVQIEQERKEKEEEKQNEAMWEAKRKVMWKEPLVEIRVFRDEDY
ncbi:hypothetical protein D6D19_09690 [Aureobasidium pullulans]|uniref:Uncharacterized protein n=1 Tax=Aureobasidium pullulans TaxID=5580 RepID=A0A4S8Z957_AURPU|nr:hypothetical protein D6D19_09690 [Aureobasidium pullulans]